MKKGKNFLGWRLYAALGGAMLLLMVMPWAWLESTFVGRFVIDVASYFSNPVRQLASGKLSEDVPGAGLLVAVMFLFGVGFAIFGVLTAKMAENAITVRVKVQGILGSLTLIAIFISLFVLGDVYQHGSPPPYHRSIPEIVLFWTFMYWAAAFSCFVFVSSVRTPAKKPTDKEIQT